MGAEAPPGLLAIEDAKPDEYYQASDQIREALHDLPEQLQQSEESQLADWIHSTDEYPTNLWMDCEYAKKACERTSARINMDVQTFKHHADHPHAQHYVNKVVIHDLMPMPYLDDYTMTAHDPFVEDFIWSMDDNRHTESKSKGLTEVDVPRLLLFADRRFIQTVRTTSASSAVEVAGRDPTRAPHAGVIEVKRHRQGLRTDDGFV